MEDKAWYKSLTLWAAKIIAVLNLAPLAVMWADSHFGLHLGANPIIINILSVVGAIVVWYGRFTAKTVLK